MAAASPAATACFLSPPPPRPRVRHSLRHLARATATRPAAATRPLALLASRPRLRDLVDSAEAARRLLASAAGHLVVVLASAAREARPLSSSLGGTIVGSKDVEFGAPDRIGRAPICGHKIKPVVHIAMG